MPHAGPPTASCPTCGHAPADVLKLAVIYRTEHDFLSEETTHILAGRHYRMKCYLCSTEFNAELPDNGKALD